MNWYPISETDIWDKIIQAEARMNIEQLRFWEVVKIPPRKWSQMPYGKAGGGFWAVAILGQLVVWYNDIEDGFNISTYKDVGVIDSYTCNQDELESAIQSILNLVQHGYSLPVCSAPFPGEFGSDNSK